ncbi:hypothetical protein E2C01_088485 [Portunus trituberculatus]|uniref:Uncharacterized protein n=1 Tax=Portunus trituberculatus TaxID=210409 RepID=A0A5B7J6B2_PORTR|nr:hypothetical protein [Portunus trituberculatus]
MSPYFFFRPRNTSTLGPSGMDRREPTTGGKFLGRPPATLRTRIAVNRTSRKVETHSPTSPIPQVSKPDISANILSADSLKHHLD